HHVFAGDAVPIGIERIDQRRVGVHAAGRFVGVLGVVPRGEIGAFRDLLIRVLRRGVATIAAASVAGAVAVAGPIAGGDDLIAVAVVAGVVGDRPVGAAGG